MKKWPLASVLFKNRKGADDKTTAAASEIVKPAVMSIMTVHLEDEIRFHSYELYLQRNGQSTNEYEDWCRAVIEISARYEAAGYQVYRKDGYWWARKVTY